MKSNKDLRGKAGAFDSGDLLKKAIKLEPIKKSGKEKRSFIKELDEDEDVDLMPLKKRESVLDYIDDGEEDSEEDDEDVDDDEDWEDEEEEDEEENEK